MGEDDLGLVPLDDATADVGVNFLLHATYNTRIKPATSHRHIFRRRRASLTDNLAALRAFGNLILCLLLLLVLSKSPA